MGSRRFTDIVRGTGAPRDRIAARLKVLEEAGVIERRAYQDHPTRFEYALTDSGARAGAGARRAAGLGAGARRGAGRPEPDAPLPHPEREAGQDPMTRTDDPSTTRRPLGRAAHPRR